MDKSEISEAAFRLKLWRRGGQTNFTSQLYDLIAKADPGNRQRLRRGFPVEVFCYEEWFAASTEIEFFKRWEAL